MNDRLKCGCGGRLNLLHGNERRVHLESLKNEDNGQAVYVCTSSCGGGVEVLPVEGDPKAQLTTALAQVEVFIEWKSRVEAACGLEKDTADAETILARVARLLAGLERLASPEAFTVSRMASKEETARMKFAQSVIEGEVK